MFKPEDKKIVLALQKIIAEGDFTLKGSAVPGFVMIMKWVKDLEGKIDEDLKPKPVKKKKKKVE